MLRIRRDQREIPRRQHLLRLTPLPTHDRPVARESKHHGVLLAVVVDGRGAVGFGDHARGADVVGQGREGVLSDHAFGLAAGGLERGGFGYDDGVLGWLWHGWRCWYECGGGFV